MDCAGNASGCDLARRSLRPEGTLILKSTYAGTLEIDASACVVDEITVLGSRCGPFEPAIAALAGAARAVKDQSFTQGVWLLVVTEKITTHLLDLLYLLHSLFYSPTRMVGDKFPDCRKLHFLISMMIAQRIRFLLLLHRIMHSVLKTVAIFSHFIKLLKSINSTFTLAVRSQKFGQAKTHFLSHHNVCYIPK